MKDQAWLRVSSQRFEGGQAEQHLKMVFKQPVQPAAPETLGQGFSCLNTKDIPCLTSTSHLGGLGAGSCGSSQAASKAVPTSALPSR